MYKYSMWLFLAHPFLLKMLVTALGTLASSTAVLFFLWAGVSRNALWGKRCVTSKKKKTAAKESDKGTRLAYFDRHCSPGSLCFQVGCV